MQYYLEMFYNSNFYICNSCYMTESKEKGKGSKCPKTKKHSSPRKETTKKVNEFCENEGEGGSDKGEEGSDEVEEVEGVKPIDSKEGTENPM